MTRSLRRLLRRCGIDVPFTAVVYPEDLKIIAIDTQWHAAVTIRRQMVFLERPDPGELRDIVPVPEAEFERSVTSPDAIDVSHRSAGRNTLVCWTPRQPIVPYAVYTHERRWTTAAADTREVLCTELPCRTKVAVMGIEITGPVIYEAAVAFRLPWWHRLVTERRLMKYALAQLETSRSRPIIRKAGAHVEWKVTGPRIGQRFVCVAFTAKGLAAWRQVLEHTSLRARLRRLLRLRGRSEGTEAAGRVLQPR